MPRRYRRQLGCRRYRDYTEVTLETALEAYANGRLSLRRAQERYGIPRATLCRKYLGKNPKNPGRQPVLGTNEEANIVKAITAAAEWGYAMTRTEIRELVKQYLDRKGIVERRFNENLPAEDWMRSFLARHNELSKRLSQNIKRYRSDVTEVEINEYFDHLEQSLEGINPDNLLNFDETNMSDDPGQSIVIVRRNKKRALKIMDNSKSSTSVMFCVSASGRTLPPYIVYKARNLYPEWMGGGEPDYVYNRSKSGWFDGQIFEDWFFKVVCPYFRHREGKKAIIGDNLASHLSVKIIEACEQQGITFIFLPPNSTHACQPLDIAYFAPLKKLWRKVLMEWKQTHSGCLPKSEFPTLLKNTLSQLAPRSEENIKSGFRASGIFPLNRVEVLKKLPGYNQVDHSDELGEAFEAIIKKHVVQPKEPVQKRKKLNVKPGQSVSLRSSRQSEEAIDVIDSENKLDDIANEVDEDDEPQPSCSNRPLNEDSEEYETDEEPEMVQHKLTKENLEEDFIIAEFCYNQGSKKECLKQFVAQIVAVKKSGYTIRCLRRYKETENIFVFPQIEDENVIQFDQIRDRLPKPTEKRGLRIFRANVVII